VSAEARLAAILRGTPHVAAALDAAGAVDPPDWLLAAGVIRDAVWDALHARPPQLPRDVDLAFFDPGDVSPAREEAVCAALAAQAPGLPWDARNQAAVHLWYPERFGVAVAPFASAAAAVATFPETATCVGVRLETNGELRVIAPFGLDDLLAGICRHNPTRAPPEVFARRVADKGWRARWPRVRFATVPPCAHS
jgi:hypothetical protein